MKTILITGTKGKTTLLFFLDYVLRKSGKKTACINSEGFFKNGKLIKDNKYFLKRYKTSANVAAIKEVREDDLDGVEYFLLESSYAGAQNIKKSLIGEHIDIGILTNVYSDHIDGVKIKNRQDLLRRKVDVLNTVKKKGKVLVFVGDKSRSISHQALNILKESRPDIEIVPYSRKVFSKEDYPGYFISDKYVMNGKNKLLDYSKINSSFKYFHKPTDSNFVLLVAVLNIFGLNPDEYLSGIFFDNIVPGRLNVFSNGSKTVILDYAHELQSLRSAASLLRKKFKKSKIIAVIRLSYYRRMKYILALTEKIADLFDEFIVYDKAVSRPALEKIFTDKFGIKKGEVSEAMKKVLSSKKKKVRKINNELDAIKFGIKKIKKEEVLYVMGDQIEKDIQCIKINLFE